MLQKLHNRRILVHSREDLEEGLDLDYSLSLHLQLCSKQRGDVQHKKRRMLQR
jgi:hypothetical protein